MKQTLKIWHFKEIILSLFCNTRAIVKSKWFIYGNCFKRLKVCEIIYFSNASPRLFALKNVVQIREISARCKIVEESIVVVDLSFYRLRRYKLHSTWIFVRNIFFL